LTCEDGVGNKCRIGVPAKRAEVMCNRHLCKVAHFRDAQILVQRMLTR